MRRNDRLFGSFLVPVSGEQNGWPGLEQALLLARLRGQHVYGLHVIPPGDEVRREAALAVQAEFTRRCREAGVDGGLTIQQGETARKICELSRWADLVILHLAHPPGTQPLAKIQSGFRTILWQCSRPVLAVPRISQEIRRILLAYDGSQKADEALFIGAYMGSYWKISLTVITVEEIGRTSPRVQRLAKDYLKRRNVEASFIAASGNVSDMVLTLAETYACDLIIMGGYGRGPMLEMVLGSTVDYVLQNSRIPVLICR